MTGFVYAIGDEHRVKIGWSADPVRRLAKISSDCPGHIRLLGAVPATKEQEAEAHELLAPWRIGREWFRHEGPVAAFVKMLPPLKPKPAAIQDDDAHPRHPLAVYRKSHGLSKTGLARLLGTSRANITRWENDNRKPDKVSLRLICQKTGIPAWELRPDVVEMIGVPEQAAS